DAWLQTLANSILVHDATPVRAPAGIASRKISGGETKRRRIDRRITMTRTFQAIALSLALVSGAAMTARADEASRSATLKDIEQTFGFVPTFMTQQPKAGFEGAWRQLKDLEFSENTVLPAKVKALIGLAVVAQI